MQNLLAPAMLLINRLSFANKFILISLLFFVPLGWLSITVIGDAYKTINKTKMQRGGVALLGDIQTLQVSLAEFRDSTFVYLYTQKTDAKGLQNQSLDKLRKQVARLKLL